MVNPAALKRYAGAHPSKTDDELAPAYIAETVTVRRPIVPISDVLQWSGSGPLDSIDTAQSFTHPDPPTQRAVRAASKAAMRMFGAAQTFNLDSPENTQLLGVFIAVGIMSPAERDSLLALGNVVQPLYSQPSEFGQIPSAEDFQAARNL